MTIEAMRTRLLGLGLKRAYRPVWEPESETITLATRRPSTIRDGRLEGSEIALQRGSREFRIWTGHRQKARRYAAAHGLKLRLLDGEAELSVPAELADTILPPLGAKVRRELSPEQLEAARSRLQRVRNASNFRKIPVKDAVPGQRNQDPASQPLPEPETPILSRLRQ